jgi:hypothetical protein
MERSLMLADWQNNIAKNSYTTKSNLHVQHNAYQNSTDILHRDRKINPKIYMKTQKTRIAKAILSQKSNAGSYHNSNYTTEP